MTVGTTLDREQSPGTTASFCRSLALSAVGVIVEWYDFAVYLYLAPILTRLFLPASDPRVSLLVTLAIFATGYLVRPLGGLFYGAIGDRFGRRSTLITSSLLMAACKLGEGLLPTYATVGVTAPVLLLVMRLASGFSMGGEYAGTFVYLVENAPSGRRGLTCSLANTMCAVGIFLASLVTALISLLPGASVLHWAWRIPFFSGAALGLLALKMRTSMRESPLFEQLMDDGELAARPLTEAVQTSSRQIALTFALGSYIAVTYHLLVAFVPVFLKTWGGLDVRTVSWIGTGAALLNIFLMWMPAAVSDRAGRKVVVGGAAIAVALLAWPVYALLAGGHPLCGALLAVPLAASVNAPAAVLAVELFATRVRFSGFALGFNLGSISGSLMPMIGTWFAMHTGPVEAPVLLLIAASAVMLAILPLLPETRNTELL